MIEMNCPHCSEELRIDVQYAGTSGKCESCGEKITVPKEFGGFIPEISPTRVIKCTYCEHMQPLPESFKGSLIECERCSEELTVLLAKIVTKNQRIENNRVLEERVQKASASTRQAAIKKALTKLGCEIHEVDIHIMDTGSKGFFGIGARDVQVALRTKRLFDGGSYGNTEGRHTGSNELAGCAGCAGCLGIAGFIFILVLSVSIFSDNKPPSSNKRSVSNIERKEEVDYGSSSGAYIYSKPYVKALLKSPSTVKFPFFPDFETTTDGKGLWTVTAYCDAQNGFGGIVRINYIVKMRYSNGEWTFVDIELEQQ